VSAPCRPLLVSHSTGGVLEVDGVAEVLGGEPAVGVVPQEDNGTGAVHGDVARDGLQVRLNAGRGQHRLHLLIVRKEQQHVGSEAYCDGKEMDDAWPWWAEAIDACHARVGGCVVEAGAPCRPTPGRRCQSRYRSRLWRTWTRRTQPIMLPLTGEGGMGRLRYTATTSSVLIPRYRALSQSGCRCFRVGQMGGGMLPILRQYQCPHL
jgi:hypothetical protein